MKIISGKKWEEMEQMLVDLQMDLSDAKNDNEIYQRQVEYLQDKIKSAKEDIEEYAGVLSLTTAKLEEEKAITKKLKTLLTKNKIDYKSLLDKKKVK